MSAGSVSKGPNATKAGAVAISDVGLRPIGTTVHVLVVEDDASVRSLLTEILQQDGYEVTAAADGQSAYRTLREVPVHALVTDFNLPDMDGLEIIQHITREYPRTVGIIMTAYGTVDLAVKAMKAGAVDFLSKPFEPVLVSLTLKKVLEVQRLRQENVILKHTVLKHPGVQVRNFSPQDMGDASRSDRRGRAGITGQIDPAIREALERGLAEGERRAMEGATGKLAAQSSMLGQVIRQLEQTCEHIVSELEEQSVQLAFEVARKIVRQCAEEKREVISTQVKTAIGRVRDAVREHALVRILVHPDDLPVMEDLREMLANIFDRPVILAFEADASLGRGGCVVQTGTRLVDATMESQLSRLAAPFRKRGHSSLSGS